jgi:hypothetical protein
LISLFITQVLIFPENGNLAVKIGERYDFAGLQLALNWDLMIYMKQKVALSAILFSLFSLSLTLPNLVQAQNNVEVKASVGKYYFSAKGIVSPYASVVMTTQNTFMSSTVADEQGNFSLPEALVNEGFTDYCLEAVDIKR